MDRSKVRILVTEDSPVTAAIIVRAVKKLGFIEVVVCSDGRKALQQINQQQASNPFGLIISDLDMPHLNGIELLTRLRRQETTANLPFIILTSRV